MLCVVMSVALFSHTKTTTTNKQTNKKAKAKSITIRNLTVGHDHHSTRISILLNR